MAKTPYKTDEDIIEYNRKFIEKEKEQFENASKGKEMLAGLRKYRAKALKQIRQDINVELAKTRKDFRHLNY